MDTITDILSSIFISNKEPTCRDATIQTECFEDQDQTALSAPPSWINSDHVEPNSTTQVSSESESELLSETTVLSSDSTLYSGSDDDITVPYIQHARRWKCVPYDLTGNSLIHHNVLIYNPSIQENINVVTMIINKLDTIDNIESMYTKDMYIFSNNRNMYKTIMLANPETHFSNLKAHGMNRDEFKNIALQRLKTLIIIDIDNLDEKEYTNYVSYLVNTNAHVLVVSTNLTNRLRAFDMLGKGAMLIQCKESLRSLQRAFFNQIVTRLCSTPIDFSTFHKAVTDACFNYYVIVGSTLYCN